MERLEDYLNEPKEITTRLRACKCGCHGADPWHKPTYKRMIRDFVAVEPEINHDEYFVDTIVARGTVKLPWGEESVVAKCLTGKGRVLRPHKPMWYLETLKR